MSFIISVYINGGIVMAADSRLTLNAKIGHGESAKDISFDFSNSTYKLFMNKRGVGVSTCGDAGIESSPIAGYIEQFLLDNHQDDVDAIANKLLVHFSSIKQKLNTTFHVAGYKEGKQKVYRVDIALNSVTQANLALQGAAWDGEVDIFQRIVNDTWLSDKVGKPGSKIPSFPIPFEFFSLQDAIDFAIFAMSATIGAIRFQNRLKTVGGPIDILVLQPDNTLWVQRKELHGEVRA